MDNYLHPEYKDFEKHFVAFIDILGFDKRARTIRSQGDFKAASLILFTLKEEANRWQKSSELYENIQAIAVSDSIIVSVPFRDIYGAYILIAILHYFQYNLIATNFRTLVRGRVEMGPLYHKDGIIFGKAYSEAFTNEKEISGPPRITVASYIVEEANKQGKLPENVGKINVLEYLNRDKNDGEYFIDYLKPIGASANLSKSQQTIERKRLMAFINSQLKKYKDDDNIKSKYEWLSNYLQKFKEN